MSDNAISLARATLNDSDFFLRVRNHPTVREKSSNPEEISAEVHQKWFAGKLQDGKSTLLVIQVAESNCGTIRFDYDSSIKQIEVSIALLPEYTGKGIAIPAMIKAEILALKIYDNARSFKARVLNDNESSKKFFSRAGYQPKEVVYLKMINS